MDNIDKLMKIYDLFGPSVVSLNDINVEIYSYEHFKSLSLLSQITKKITTSFKFFKQ
jgi:hypothetical protein